jgi:hypothetical protein
MKKSTPLPKLLEKTQKVFNAYIRARDKELGCISCGAEVEQAGHYHSQGHHSALRFNPINTNGQCRRCNMFLHGNLIKYRQGLVDRYGEMVVLDLEDSANKNRLKKWSRDELEQLISQYKQTL